MKQSPQNKKKKGRPKDIGKIVRFELMEEVRKRWEENKRRKELANVEFQDEKGRFKPGTGNPKARLTKQQAFKIVIRTTQFLQSRRNAGAPYGVSHATVQRIMSGQHSFCSYSPSSDMMQKLLMEVVAELKEEKAEIDRR